MMCFLPGRRPHPLRWGKEVLVIVAGCQRWSVHGGAAGPGPCMRPPPAPPPPPRVLKDSGAGSATNKCL